MTLTAFVAGGCNNGGDTQEPNILFSFPIEWTPLTVDANAGWQLFTSTALWQSVNIDGDPDTEYLVLYAYDNSALDASDGPVGAVVYDFQDTSEFVVGQPSLPIPLQPSGNFIPYRLLPSYWEGLDGAFISNSSTSPIGVFPVRRTTEGEGLLTETAAGIGNELVLVSANTILTFVWWRNVFDGYGVTQILGPAGFRNINGDPGATLDSWAQSNDPVVITQADALFPIYAPVRPDGRPADDRTADIGRSLLCHVIHYIRDEPEPPHPSAVAGETYQSDITYIARPQGIHFCRAAPPIHPFYPEGVVVKYMYAQPNGREALILPTLEDYQKNAILDATTFDPDREWIADIETRADIDYPEAFRTTQPPDLPDSNQPTLVETRQLMTQVCVKLQPRLSNPGEPRLLYFSLLNEPPSVVETGAGDASAGEVQRVSDLLWITNLEDATDWGVADCTELVNLEANRDLTPSQ